MSMSLHSRIHWPPSILAVAVVFLIGGTLLLAAIAIRRKYRSATGATAATLVLLLAVLWNGAIVLAFMSPHNRHVIHLATHRASVFTNAAVGIVWLSLCVFCAVKWFHRASARSKPPYPFAT
jgi:ABC-type Na+ efflux pump permease subunit